jgi:magnesium transporter
MVTIFVHRQGLTEEVTSIERGWLSPSAGVFLWVDLAAPSIPESLLLSDTFVFHRLAVEDAMSSGQSPKVEAYDGYLFAVLRGADAEVDFFVGPSFLVSVHRSDSQAITELADNARHGAKWMAEGPVGVFHRAADAVIDGFRPELERIRGCTDDLESRLFDKASAAVLRDLLTARRKVFELCQTSTAQRLAIERLARREFVDISTEMSLRFRDVHDHLVRISADAAACDDRLACLLTASVSLSSGRRWF